MQRYVIRHCRNDEILIEYLDLIVSDDVPCRDNTTLVPFDPQCLGNQRVVLDNNGFQIQTNVRDIFHDAGNRREFVLDALNLDACDRTSFQAGKQDTAQAVANRGTKPTLERLNDKLAIGACQGLFFGNDPIRQFKAAPSNSH